MECLDRETGRGPPLVTTSGGEERRQRKHGEDNEIPQRNKDTHVTKLGLRFRVASNPRRGLEDPEHEAPLGREPTPEPYSEKGTKESGLRPPVGSPGVGMPSALSCNEVVEGAK